MRVGGAGRYARSICIDGCHSGHKNMALTEGVAVVERWQKNSGFLSTTLNSDAVRTQGEWLL